MNDPLADLKDIHLPAPVSWWPPAPGWWILLGLLIAIIVGTIWFIAYRKKYGAWRKAALKELTLIEQSGLSASDQIEAIATLVRRSVISAEKIYRKPAMAAQLEGQQWQEYLQKSMPAESAQWIAIERYQPSANIVIETLLASTRKFIKGFKP